MDLVPLLTIGSILLGNIIKGYIDKTKVESDLNLLKEWKTRVEESTCTSTERCMYSRKECRDEIFKEITRTEKKSEDLVKMIELQNSKIGEVRENIIKIITLLERKEK